MAVLITNERVEALKDDYELGVIWNNASTTERLKAVNTAEGIWRALDWDRSPFSLADLATELEFPLAIHAREFLESEGASTVLPEAVEQFLAPYLRPETSSYKAVSFSQGNVQEHSTLTGGGTSTGGGTTTGGTGLTSIQAEELRKSVDVEAIDISDDDLNFYSHDGTHKGINLEGAVEDNVWRWAWGLSLIHI